MSTSVALSKRIAHALRHSPSSVGISLESDGSTEVDMLAQALGVHPSEIVDVVVNDEKGRFVIEKTRIWAEHGHSFPVNVRMARVESPGLLYHGTKYQFLGSIKAHGLLPMDRQWVHLSTNVDTATLVADRRKGATVLLQIDGDALVEAGMDVFQSESDIVCVGNVPWDFITIVE